jgi:hypothetical protein
MPAMSNRSVAPTARPVPSRTGRVAPGLRRADAAWPLLSVLALLAMPVLVGVDTPTQQLRAHDVAQSLGLLLGL